MTDEHQNYTTAKESESLAPRDCSGSMDAEKAMVKAAHVDVIDDVEICVASSCGGTCCSKNISVLMTSISSWMSYDHQAPHGADPAPLADGRMESLPLRR